MRSVGWVWVVCLAWLVVLAGCDSDEAAEPCVTGATLPCACDAGGPGAQTCADGGFGACVCLSGSTSFLSGRVFDAETGRAVPAATLTSKTGELAESDANGNFVLLSSPTSPQVEISKENYVASVKRPPQQVSYMEVFIKDVDKTAEFDADKGVKVTLDSGASVDIPGGAVRDAEGKRVKGKLKLSLAEVDGSVRTQASALPGELKGENDKGEKGLVAVAWALEITVTDEKGAKMQVAPESKVVAELPARTKDMERTGFRYDEEKEAWADDGKVKRGTNAKGDTVYRKDIDHLSWHGYGDFFAKLTCLSVCVEDAEKKRLAGAQVWLVGASFPGVSSQFADADGCAVAEAPVSQELVLVGQVGGVASMAQRFMTGATERALSESAGACDKADPLVIGAAAAGGCPAGFQACGDQCIDVATGAPACERDGGTDPVDMPDAAVRMDASVGMDAAVTPDAAVGDAAVRVDGSRGPDATIGTDGGAVLDAGPPDAGSIGTLIALAAGIDHVCALYSGGPVYCWGDNSDGAGGQGSAASIVPPGRVVLSTGVPLANATQIASNAGANHTCALRSDGSVVCWGSNSLGQCGADAPVGEAPRAYTVPGVTGAVAVGAGTEHSCAVLSNGRVSCWGNNATGQLGSGSITPASSSAPVTMLQVGVDENVEITDAVAVVGGRSHTCVLHGTGSRMTCVGSNSAGGGWTGILGRGTLAEGSYPVANDVALPVSTTVKSMHIGTGFYASHTCVIATAGRPICWGTNTYSQLASSGGGIPTPQQIDAYYTQPSLVALGRDFTCVAYVNSDFGERVACQGSNGSGQLGDSKSGVSSDSIPDDVGTALDRSTFLSGVELMTAGAQFVCVKLATGNVTCWGSNTGEVFGAAGPTRTFCDLSATVPGLP